MIAWTSFVVDPRTSKVYSLANGGHNDYAGNEVDELDLERAPPMWTQRLAPTPNTQVTNCQSYYADGRPASRHTYYGVTLDVANDRIMLFGGSHWCSAGGGHAAVSSYNIAANSYNLSGTHPDQAHNSLAVAYSVDPSTGDVYHVENFTLRRWNRSSNTHSTLSPGGTAAYGIESMSAIDTARGRMLIIGGLDSDHHLYTIGTNAFSTVTLSGPNAAAIANVIGGAMIYVPAIDRFLVRRGAAGGTVYQVHPTTFEVTTFFTTGGASIPITQNGPYNKFLYVPRLGGVVYVPTYSGNAWFLRLH